MAGGRARVIVGGGGRSPAEVRNQGRRRVPTRDASFRKKYARVRTMSEKLGGSLSKNCPKYVRVRNCPKTNNRYNVDT